MGDDITRSNKDGFFGENKNNLNPSDWNKSDIELGDMFDIGPYNYFLVTEIDTEEETVSGFVRDGVAVIGDQHPAEYNLSDIVSKLQSKTWTYQGSYTQFVPDEE